MTYRRIPILTISLVIAIISFHWLVEDKTPLYSSATAIFQGEVWRLITGHFIHADLHHLFWNCLGLAVLGSLLEYRSKRMLLIALATGMVFVNALLLSPYSQLDYYCGLSGALNTLLLLALWLEWKSTQSWIIAAIALGVITKTLIEVSQGVSLMTHISWPPYAWSHVAGLTGGVFVIWIVSMFGGSEVARYLTSGLAVNTSM
jgi:rhomboid family GlyGly-CTERM serine protease